MFRKDLLPLKTRQTTPVGYYLSLIDQMNKFRALLVFVIFTDRNFAATRAMPEWKPGSGKKTTGNMIDI